MRLGTGVGVALSLWGLAGPGQAQIVDDVWQLDLKSGVWTRLAAVPDPVAGSPGPRRHCPHAFDSARGRMIVSGGEGKSTFSDTWALDLQSGGSASWSLLNAAALDTPFTYRPAFYDPRRDRFVVAHSVDHLDVLDLATNTWQMPASVNSGVIQHYQLFGTSHSAVYDSINDRYCVFGGGVITEIPSYFNNHVHMLDPDALVWSELALTPAPLPRGMAAATYDPESSCLTLFGGGLGGGSTGTLYNDTWRLSLQNGSQQWTEVPVALAPSARGQAAVVFDSLRKRMIVLSGLRYVPRSCGSGTYTGIDDVWVLENDVWRELPTAGDRPGPRRGAAAVYDPVHDRVILFGGEVIGLKAPGNLTAVVAGSGTVDLTWTDHATGEVGYVVRRWCNGGAGETIATLGPDTQAYTDPSASCGTCGYAVQAVGNCGIVSPDAEAVVVDPCAEPLAIVCPPVPEPIMLDQACQATVPDLASTATVTGGRAPVSVTQVPAPGEPVGQGNHEITLTATDASGTRVGCTVSISVVDMTPPTVSITEPVSWTSFPVGKEVGFAGSFVEPCVVGAATWSLVCGGRELVVPGVLDPQAGTISATHAFAEPGVYAVRLAVTDSAGNVGSAGAAPEAENSGPIVVIYDPGGGFITGGGWFNSPAGSCVADATTTGKAILTVHAKYRTGATAPHGHVEFLLKAGDLRFRADDLDWLVVTDQKAQLAGVGSVNGREGYPFILTVVMGGGGEAVRLSIRDRAGAVYDNRLGAEPTSDVATPLAGGAIVLHP